MKQDWLDKKLKYELQDFESNMDLESVWGDIESKRKKRNKRPALILLSGILFLALASLVTFNYFIGTENMQPSDPINEQSAANFTADLKTKNNSNQKIETKIKQADSQSNVLSNNSKNRELNLKNKNPQFNLKANSGNKHPNPINLNKNNLQANNTVTSKAIAKIQTEAQQIAANKKQSLYNKKLFNKIPTLKLYLLNKSNIISTVSNFPFDFKKPKRPKNHWGVALIYGKYFRSLNATSTENKEWINNRNKLETPLDAIYAEVFYRKYLSPKLFLQTGVSYLQNTARLENLVENNHTKTVDNQLIEIIRYADGSEEEIYGEGTAQFSESEFSTKYLKSRSFLLPVLIGLEIPINKKSGFIFSGGAAVSIFSKQSGQTISKESTGGNYSALSDFEYKKYGAIYGQANTDFYIKLNKYARLSGGLQSMVSFNNQVRSKNGFEDKYRHLGARISIMIAF